MKLPKRFCIALLLILTINFFSFFFLYEDNSIKKINELYRFSLQFLLVGVVGVIGYWYVKTTSISILKFAWILIYSFSLSFFIVIGLLALNKTIISSNLRTMIANTRFFLLSPLPLFCYYVLGLNTKQRP